MKVESICNYRYNPAKNNFRGKRLQRYIPNGNAIRNFFAASTVVLMTLTGCYFEKKHPTDKEITELTGFNKVEFDTANQILLEHVNNIDSAEYGKFYSQKVLGRIGFDANGNYCMKYTNLKTKSYNVFYTKNNLRIGDARIELAEEPDGEFTLICVQGDNATIKNYTKDGELKKGSYLPDNY